MILGILDDFGFWLGLLDLLFGLILGKNAPAHGIVQLKDDA